jgi:hydroxyacylglutathione hydrolase
MIIKRLVSKGISANAYFIGANNQGVVIDPQRDVDRYLQLAEENDVKITTIFDTHRNEDFVNGSPELAAQTGATIYHGDKIDFKYGQQVKEKDSFKIDNLVFEILETPGHSPESISIVMKTSDNPEEPYAVFTGDTLFVGEVGRIDFYRDAENQRKGAEWIYDSLFNKLLKLPDATIVFPAHGAGSICGGSIGSLPYSTIGYEKKTSKTLQLTKKEFIDYKANQRYEIAPNMSMLEKLNLEGPPILNGLIRPKTLTVNEVKEHIKNGSQVVDVREPESFAGGFIPGTFTIWKNGLPTFGLWLLDYERPIVIIKSQHQDIDLIVRYLIRLGYDNIIGYLNGFRKWYMSGQKFERTDVWSVHQLNDHLGDKDLFLLDVRTEHSLQESGKIRGANHVFIGQLPDRLDKVPKDKTVCVYCDSGFKAKIGASILKKNGYKNVVSVFGSMSAWQNAGCPIEEMD